MNALLAPAGAFFLVLGVGGIIWGITEHPLYGSRCDRAWRTPGAILLLALAVALLVSAGAPA